MLELRPSCENCDTDLSANSTNAMICSFECTFCRNCVEQHLKNVCPNCGGGFAQRPIRPSNNWKDGNDLYNHPVAEKRTFKPLDLDKHQKFATPIESIHPRNR